MRQTLKPCILSCFHLGSGYISDLIDRIVGICFPPASFMNY